MDQDRTVGRLRDELGLEIERVLAIDPAPELKMRVRARINRERASPAWWARWRLVGAGAFAMAVVTALVFIRPEREPQPALPDEQAIATPIVAPPPAAAPATQAMSPPAQPVVSPTQTAGRRRVPVQSAAPTTEPEVLVPPGEAALRLLVANIRGGYIDPAVLSQIQPADTPLQPLAEIAIQPITIEPLARLEPLEGARQ